MIGVLPFFFLTDIIAWLATGAAKSCFAVRGIVRESQASTSIDGNGLRSIRNVYWGLGGSSPVTLVSYGG